MKRSGFIAAALLALYWVLAVSVSPRMGVTGDEVVHLTAGYSYWKTNDYRLQPENGTLAMRTAALPLLALDNVRWIAPDDPDWRVSQVNRIGEDFFFHLGNPLALMQLLSRGAIALLGVLALWLTWRWARGLFGARAGWLALVLAVFCPALLAHGALATSDMAITAALLAVVSIFWRLMHVVTWPRLLLTAVAGSAVLLAKMSGVLAAPMLGALVVWRWTRPAPLVVRLGGKTRWVRSRARIAGITTALAVVLAGASLVGVWAGYGFRYSAFNGPQPAGTQFFFPWDQILEQAPVPDDWIGDVPSRMATEVPKPSPTAATRFIGWMREHELLPEAYLWGMAHTYKFSRSRPAFLNGESRLTGWPEFFPWTFWLKTTLPALALLLAGIAAVIAFKPARSRRLYRAAPLLVLFVIYWVVALRTHLNIGHRHILPTYPVVYVFAGATALWLGTRASRLVGAGLALAVAGHALDSTLARPFYLSYFQPFGGGQSGGWRHLVDSSFDWGQGVPDLKKWLADHAAAGDTAPVYITYFGPDIPPTLPPRVVRFADEVSDSGVRAFPVRPRGGWFAIGATHFQRLYLRVPGPWGTRYENFYQQARAELTPGAGAKLDAAGQARLVRVAMDFEVLEFGRLCYYLRNRDPEEIVGGSILMFHLTDKEVAFALTAPLPAITAATTPAP